MAIFPARMGLQFEKNCARLWFMGKGNALFLLIAFLLPGLVCAQPANDNFTNSVQLTGINVTYAGNFDGATTEPGEPLSLATNTVWLSWMAATNGFASVNLSPAAQSQYYDVFTGSSVSQLSRVWLGSTGGGGSRFFASAGTVYDFQVCGGADNYTFNLQFQAFNPPSDNFSNAIICRGQNTTFPSEQIDNATMEPGEPTPLGNVAQKSIWWQWQAPVSGAVTLISQGTASGVAIAAYTGDAVNGLTQIGEATNFQLYLPSVLEGQTYHCSVTVPAAANGSAQLRTYYGGLDTQSHPVAGNLLQEWSWEGTGVVDAQYWKWSGGLNGYVNQSGGADGTTWPQLAPGTAIWQDFPTIPGHTYHVRFAYEPGGSSGVQVAVTWDTNSLGVSQIPLLEGFWHWDDYTYVAVNTTSRITFLNLRDFANMDAFSVVDVSAPPAVSTQPLSLSSVSGGSATFLVQVTGTPPMSYQWYFGSRLLAGQTNSELTLTSLTTNQTGNYQVIITNAYGSATSQIASLSVSSVSGATILAQPYGDTIPVGGYYDFTVVASGTVPLSYQWFFNNEAIPEATNNNLMLADVQTTNAGTYTVWVSNHWGAVLSLPAALNVDASLAGGGLINFRNQNFFNGVTNLSVPIFDVDGVTPLNGTGYVAQLYAGPSLDLLRPAGQPTPFQTGMNAGYFVPQTITLGNVAPGSNAVLQVCAWDSNYGTTYEQARSLGGRFGKSVIMQVPAGGGGASAQTLQGFQSFNLLGGLPFFEVGQISFVEFQPPNTMVWSLHGQTNSIYLIEKSIGGLGTVWQPFTVLTNISGTALFTDTNSRARMVYYRSRILD